ncbi:MAG: hypothetical protein LBV72_07475 [Tannerella sp.]|jgi:hypothetical protein|nr:hypothetical protein [Tannerella sp.]
MKMNIHSITGGIAVLSLLFLLGCQTKHTATAFYTYETECLNTELDGSETLRAWGSGRNKTDAIEQAKKNAIRDVLFKGIRNGNGGCSTKPLILEVNAEEKYAYYFNTFFQDAGAYKEYISMEDTKNGSTASESTRQQDKYGTVVRVLRSKLKDRLIQDEILKP